MHNPAWRPASFYLLGKTLDSIDLSMVMSFKSTSQTLCRQGTLLQALHYQKARGCTFSSSGYYRLHMTLTLWALTVISIQPLLNNINA